MNTTRYEIANSSVAAFANAPKASDDVVPNLCGLEFKPQGDGRWSAYVTFDGEGYGILCSHRAALQAVGYYVVPKSIAFDVEKCDAASHDAIVAAVTAEVLPVVAKEMADREHAKANPKELPSFLFGGTAGKPRHGGF